MDTVYSILERVKKKIINTYEYTVCYGELDYDERREQDPELSLHVPSQHCPCASNHTECIVALHLLGMKKPCYLSPISNILSPLKTMVGINPPSIYCNSINPEMGRSRGFNSHKLLSQNAKLL